MLPPLFPPLSLSKEVEEPPSREMSKACLGERMHEERLCVRTADIAGFAMRPPSAGRTERSRAVKARPFESAPFQPPYAIAGSVPTHIVHAASCDLIRGFFGNHQECFHDIPEAADMLLVE